MRSEQEIFNDLTVLCGSPGFIHAIAAICFRDNVVSFDSELKAEDMAPMFSMSRLIRTEVTTLIGLMMRTPIDCSMPAPEILSGYIAQAETLLQELHQAMANACVDIITTENVAESSIDPFSLGACLRETIFYSGEAAYTFQYRDLAPRKYRADAIWLLQNKGIDLEVGCAICRSLCELADRRLIKTLEKLRGKPVTEWTMLPGFTFSCEELAAQTGYPVESVKAIITAFTVPDGERNTTFTTLHAFNAAYAYPIIRKGQDEFVLLQYYGISEALYEAPFYWMYADDTYAPTASRHRGEFTEGFSNERLAGVFGFNHVFRNVEILRSKGEVLGEIDVLVLFGDHAIVLQAKSKKLTLKARKGNDLQLQGDFKAAVQESVDQAYKCAELLGDHSVTLRCRDGTTVLLAERPQTIFPMSVVADHYPALAFQTHQFLQTKSNEQITRPLVIDVFALDTITEMLASPLRFLSYLSLRARFGEKLMVSHEHTLLSYHLKYNLWLGNDTDLVWLDDDFSAHLDVAMAVRRDGISGAATPDGILTRFEGIPFAKIIAEIERAPNPVAIHLGLMLLELGEGTVQTINEHLERILAQTAEDGGLHDMTIGISGTSAGLTVHCSRLTDSEVAIKLRSHCEHRKYSRKANRWFGLAIRPDGSIQLAGELTGSWEFNSEMEKVLESIP